MSKQVDKPEVFGISRRRHNWMLKRRSFLAGAVAAGVASVGSKAGRKARIVGDDALPAGKAKYKFCHRVGTHMGLEGLYFSPNGKTVVTRSSKNVWENQVKFWSYPLGSMETTWKHPGDLSKMDISPDGKWIVTIDSKSVMRLWKFHNRKLLKQVKAGGWESQKIQVTPDNKKIVNIDWKSGLKLWSLPDLKLLEKIGTIGATKSFAISPDGKMLATGYYPFEVIALYSLENGKEGELINKFGDFEKVSDPDCFAFSNDGKYLITGSAFDKTIRVWTVPDGKQTKSFQRAAGEFCEPVYFVLSPNGKYLAVMEETEHVRVYRFPSCKLLRILAKGEDDDETWKLPSCIAFSPDSKRLLIGHHYRLGVWNFKTGKLLRCFMDVNATLSIRNGRTYKYRGEDNKWVKVTVPDCKCAPKMPADAKCTCDTVAGKIPAGGCSVVYYYPN